MISKVDIRRVRPGFGLPPKYFDWVVGKKVIADVEFGDAVTLDVLQNDGEWLDSQKKSNSDFQSYLKNKLKKLITSQTVCRRNHTS